MTKPCTFFLAVALGVALPVVCPGADWQPEIELQVRTAQYDARETSTGGALLNRDRGQLQGAAAQISAEALSIRWSLFVGRLQGDIAYSGYTQLGLPLQTITSLQLDRVQLALEPLARLPLGVGSLGLAFGPGGLRIERDIAPTLRSLGTVETLQTATLMLGVNWRQTLPGQGSLQAGISGNWTINQRLAVNTFGVLDDFTLRPGRQAWASLEVSARWPLASEVSVVARLSAETLRFGASSAILVSRGDRVVGVSSYPGSNQQLLGGSIGVNIAF